MSIYNILHLKTQCHRCNENSYFEIECFFGFRNLIDMKIGDTVKWVEGKSVKNGGRPKDGIFRGKGYSECPLCHKDFFVDVIIENDKIKGIEKNEFNAPYIK